MASLREILKRHKNRKPGDFNGELALKIAKYLRLDGPKRVGYIQRTWASKLSDQAPFDDRRPEDRPHSECGTVACLAGIALIVEGYPATNLLKAGKGTTDGESVVPMVAQKALGLTDIAAAKLLHHTGLHWPVNASKNPTKEEAADVMERLARGEFPGYLRG